MRLISPSGVSTCAVCAAEKLVSEKKGGGPGVAGPHPHPQAEKAALWTLCSGSCGSRQEIGLAAVSVNLDFRGGSFGLHVQVVTLSFPIATDLGEDGGREPLPINLEGEAAPALGACV